MKNSRKKSILVFGWKKFWMKIPRIVSLMCNCLMVYYQLVCSRLACQSPTQSKYEEFSIKSKMQKRHSTWPNMLKERMCKHLIAKREFIFWRKRLPRTTRGRLRSKEGFLIMTTQPAWIILYAWLHSEEKESPTLAWPLQGASQGTSK